MSTSPSTRHQTVSPWLGALRDSSRHLDNLVADLSAEQLERGSFASDWSVGQILSHLGSAAEICAGLVRRGLAGDDRAPRRQDLLQIWERWDALHAADQRRAWQDADLGHLQLLGSITPGQEAELRVPYFSGPLTLPQYAGYRLSEQAVHGWDAEVAFNADATVHHLDLLWPRLDLMVPRFHDANVRGQLTGHTVALVREDSKDLATLTIDDEVHFAAESTGASTTTLVGTTDALLRLFYGRHRASDDVRSRGAVGIDDLAELFLGF